MTSNNMQKIEYRHELNKPRIRTKKLIWFMNKWIVIYESLL